MGRVNGSNKRRKTNSGSRAGQPRRDVVPMDMEQVLATKAELRKQLASLGATPPSYVTEKQLKTSDVRCGQARLLFSCKSSGTLSPLAACFTKLEAQLVVDKKDGMLVTAFDGDGRRYDLTCKYLSSNNGYRFIHGWNAFLGSNGLLLKDDGGTFQRDMWIELWQFRSRELPNRWVEVEDEVTKEKEKKKIYEDTGHPDGALGLVLLHYEYGAEKHTRAQDDHQVDKEPVMPAATPLTQQQAMPVACTASTGQHEAGEKHGGQDDHQVDKKPVIPAATPVTQQQAMPVACTASTGQHEAGELAMTKDEFVDKCGPKVQRAAIEMQKTAWINKSG